MNETFAHRLKKALEIRGLTQKELCEKTNIPTSAMSQYINGKFNAKQKRVMLLAKILNVSEPWLMGLDVPMEKNELSKPQIILSDLLYQIEECCGVEAREMFKIYMLLDDRDKAKAEERIFSLYDNEKYKQKRLSNKKAT